MWSLYVAMIVECSIEILLNVVIILFNNLLSVYYPFSDRVGLPLHNIHSPFLSVMNIFFVDLKFCHIHFQVQLVVIP